MISVLKYAIKIYLGIQDGWECSVAEVKSLSHYLQIEPAII